MICLKNALAIGRVWEKIPIVTEESLRMFWMVRPKVIRVDL